MGEATLGFLAFKRGCSIVPPTAFGGESVPDEQIHGGERAAVLVNPSENFLIGAPGKRALFQRVIGYSDKMAQAAVESLADEFVMLGVQLAPGVEPDFLQRAREKVEPAELLEGGEGTLDHGGN